MMCHAVPDSLGTCLLWSLLRRRGHEGSVRSRDTGKRNLESNLHVSWRPGRVDILDVGTTDLSAYMILVMVDRCSDPIIYDTW